MTPRRGATWLLSALFLLQRPGCLSLSGPRRVTGTVGGSLSVQCRYEEEFRDHNKYWCRSPCVLSLEHIVETTESEREVRRGRVSIRDRPATLTFTVTVARLTAGDEGTYWCGIHKRWKDSTFQVVVSVSPARTSTPTSTATTATTTATTSTAPAPAPPVSTAPATNATRSKNSQDGAQPHPGPGLPVLLILLVLLLLILVGASLLACSMVRRRGKAGGDPEPLQSPCQATPQSEPCYANLELQMRPLRAAPEHPQQEEVEYSLVQPPREDLHYSSVVFAPPRHPEDQRPPKPEPEYSVIRQKT